MKNVKNVFTAVHGFQRGTGTSLVSLLDLHLGHVADAFFICTYGGWVNGQNWKTRPVCHVCVHPGP